MTIPIPGVCRYCAITDAEIEASDSLGWHDRRHTCCTKYSCIKQWFADQERAEHLLRQSRRKKTPAEVHAEIMNRKRRKKGRAA